MNRLIIVLIFLCLPCSAYPQDIWTYYTDKLPGQVIDMAQDKYGNYWFATNNGVCELDTNGCWHYLADSTVWDTTLIFIKQIEIDHNNNKWIVGYTRTNGKQYAVKYDDSTFTYYNPSGGEGPTSIHSLGVDSSRQHLGWFPG